MASAMLLLRADPDAVSVGPEVVARLARLGVTRMDLLRDGESVAVVLDGWAFDPDRSLEAAAEALANGWEGIRAFRSMARLSVAGVSGAASPTPEAEG